MRVGVCLGGTKAELDPKPHLFLNDSAADLVVHLIQSAFDQVGLRGEDGHARMCESLGHFFPCTSDVLERV